MKDDFEGGATWAFEVGDQSMSCPIIVEDLDPPRQLMIEVYNSFLFIGLLLAAFWWHMLLQYLCSNIYLFVFCLFLNVPIPVLNSG